MRSASGCAGSLSRGRPRAPPRRRTRPACRAHKGWPKLRDVWEKYRPSPHDKDHQLSRLIPAHRPRRGPHGAHPGLLRATHAERHAVRGRGAGDAIRRLPQRHPLRAGQLRARGVPYSRRNSGRQDFGASQDSTGANGKSRLISAPISLTFWRAVNSLSRAFRVLLPAAAAPASLFAHSA